MQKILFIKMGSFSHINDSVFKQLSINFPNYELETLDILAFFDNLKFRKIFSYYYLIKEYGFDFLLRHKSRYDYKTWETVTSYAFKLIKNHIIKIVAKHPEKYVFTFQTQSMFDGSTDVVPHFLYTDSTVLANQWYPEIDMKTVLKSKSWMKLEPTIYQNASLNFTFSTNQSKSLIKQYSIPENKVECVFAGSNVIYSEFINKKYTSKNILFVGVNWERKGGPILLDAFKKLLVKVPDATLTVIGCKPNINHPNINIIGKIPLEQVKLHYEKASVFCMPTKLEPFGIVFVEAMMNKLPIVSSNIGALPDMITHSYNGFLHNWDDSTGISESLFKLVSNSQKCTDFGQKSYEIANNKYTWDKVGKAMKKSISKFIS